MIRGAFYHYNRRWSLLYWLRDVLTWMFVIKYVWFTVTDGHTVTSNSYYNYTYTAWRGRWQPGWAPATSWSPPSSSSSSSSTRVSHVSWCLQDWYYCKYFPRTPHSTPSTALAELKCPVFIFATALWTSHHYCGHIEVCLSSHQTDWFDGCRYLCSQRC